MTTQNRSINRDHSRLPVIPLIMPVYDQYLHAAHPRLRIQINATAFPVSSDPSEVEFELTSSLKIFIFGCEAANALEMRIKKSINDLPEVIDLSVLIEQYREALHRAEQANDEYFANRDQEFRSRLEQYAREQANLGQLSDDQLKAKDRRRAATRQERLDEERRELDNILRANSKLLPHPIRNADKPEELEEADDLEKTVCVSIQELSEKVDQIIQSRDNFVYAKENERPFVLQILRDYLLDVLNESPDEETFTRFVHPFMNDRFTIYELEDSFGKEFDVQTDERGLPLDAETSPISVDLRIIRFAIETGEVELHEGNFAFFPRRLDGDDEESFGLIGSFTKGCFELVVIPPRVRNAILACEQTWMLGIKSLIQGMYQQSAPTIGAQPQEQEKPVVESQEIAPADESSPPEDKPDTDLLSEPPPETEEANEHRLPQDSLPDDGNLPAFELDEGSDPNASPEIIINN